MARATRGLRALRLGAGVCLIGALLFASGASRALDLTAEARRLVGAGQGVHVETEAGEVLASEAAARAVHPASVSKIPTTLALLRKLGPDHRFETRFVAGGPITADRIDGPLVVEASGDPYFVDENAILTLRALERLGLHRVAGDLVVEGKLLFNWKADRLAPRLQRAFQGGVSREAWQAVRARLGVEAAAAPPSLRFEHAKVGARKRQAATARLLVTHRSQPLLYMLKALNGYSNNIFAPFAEAAGGIRSVESRVRSELPPALRQELILGDGAGAHPANRMSPRATVAILKRLAGALAERDLDLSDVMPVAGVDEGTLKNRLKAPNQSGKVVAKTGTYGNYGACALAGAFRTRAHGLVYFAILNRGVPIEEGRRRQDAYVAMLIEELDAEAWGYTRDDAPAFTRAEIVPAPSR